MSQKTRYAGISKCVKKVIQGKTIYLYKSWDLMHGYGWFAHSYFNCCVGFGFHKTNKFTAV